MLDMFIQAQSNIYLSIYFQELEVARGQVHFSFSDGRCGINDDVKKLKRKVLKCSRNSFIIASWTFFPSLAPFLVGLSVLHSFHFLPIFIPDTNNIWRRFTFISINESIHDHELLL